MVKRISNKGEKGFTLIELVIVIVILGILAAVAALSFSNMTQNAKIGVAKANLRAMKSAVMMYQVGNAGDLPKPSGKMAQPADGNSGHQGIDKFKSMLEETAYTKPSKYTYVYSEVRPAIDSKYNVPDNAKYYLYVYGDGIEIGQEGTIYLFN